MACEEHVRACAGWGEGRATVLVRGATHANRAPSPKTRCRGPAPSCMASGAPTGESLPLAPLNV